MANPRQIIIITDEALARFLRQLSTLLSDPALGYRGAAVQAVLGMLASSLLSEDEEVGELLQDVISQVERLVTRTVSVEDPNSETGVGTRMVEPDKTEWYDLRGMAEAVQQLCGE